MARYYSTAYGDDRRYTADPDGAVTSPTPGFIPDETTNRAIIRYKRAKMTIPEPLAADALRFMSFRSSDRLIELWVSNRDFTGGDLTITWAEQVAFAQSEAILSAGNVMVAALDISSDGFRTEQFDTSGNMRRDDRGRPIWMNINQGTAVYGGDSNSIDPRIGVDLVGSIANPNGGGTIVLEAYYTQGSGRGDHGHGDDAS